MTIRRPGLGDFSFDKYKRIVRATWITKDALTLRQKFGRYAACMGVVAQLYFEKTGEMLASPACLEVLRICEGEALYISHRPKKRKKPKKKRLKRPWMAANRPGQEEPNVNQPE